MTRFFLSLVTAVLSGDGARMQAMLEEYLGGAKDETRCASLGSVAPLVAALGIRKMGHWVFEPEADLTREEVTLQAAIRARLDGNVDAASVVLANLHDEGGCAAVQLFVILAVHLCADVHVAHLSTLN